MKSILFVILLLISNNSLNAQRGTPPGERPLKHHELVIMKPGDISKGIAYGDSKDKLIKLLGNPTKIEDYYFEIEEAHGKIYYYNKNKLFVLNNKIFSFDLFDDTLAFGKLNKFQIKVNQVVTIKNRKSYIGEFEVTNNRRGIVGNSMNIDYTSFVRNSGLLNVKNERIDDAGFDVLIRNNKVVFIHLGEY